MGSENKSGSPTMLLWNKVDKIKKISQEVKIHRIMYHSGQ